MRCDCKMHNGGILAREEELTRATRMLDLGTLDRLYADDVVVTGVLDETCAKPAIMDELGEMSVSEVS